MAEIKLLKGCGYDTVGQSLKKCFICNAKTYWTVFYNQWGVITVAYKNYFE